MGKKIDFYTNIVYGGFSAQDLETGVGGSEEKLIELAAGLASAGHEVTVYHNGVHGEFSGVKYIDHREFDPNKKRDYFISFKFKPILENSINATHKLHWTTEIEAPWYDYELDRIDNVICISNFHRQRMRSENPKVIHDYLWADTDRLDRNRVPKKEGVALYSSSFDRGLEELLTYWPLVQSELGIKKLLVTYGWDFMSQSIGVNPALTTWKLKMDKLLAQENIELLGRISNDDICKLYWEAEYWFLPLNKPEAELFCINAIKAQYCEAKPVVRRIGALQETVNQFVDWDQLLGQKVAKSTFTSKSLKENRKFAEKFNFGKALDRWIARINQ